MHIRFIASNYPSAANPTRGTFAREIVEMLRTQGDTVDVLAPEKLKGWSVLRARMSAQAARPDVAQPLYPGFSNRTIGPIRSASASLKSFHWAAARAERGMATPDVYIGHFLLPSAEVAASLGERRGVPAVALLDESDPTRYLTGYGVDRVRRALGAVDGVIAVNDALADFAIEYGHVDRSRLMVAPNGADVTRFRPLDQAECRRRLGISYEGTLVVFVGQFSDRKGPLRLTAALRSLSGVKGLFVGAGPEQPTGPEVLDARPYPHDLIPVVLGAADVFVLPTYAEGCCNAVLEALACGKPVVCGPAFGPGREVDNPAVYQIDARSPNAIAAGITQALGDLQADSAAVTDAAREFACEHSLQGRMVRVRSWIADHIIGAN